MLVTPETLHFSQPLKLECGRTLDKYELIIETYGKLNKNKSNAILICHALTGSHHAAGHYESNTKPGWWDIMIGPEKPIDTNKFFVVSPNNIGGCNGSTGPTAQDPTTNKIYGPNFPMVTVHDWVQSQSLLADRLGIETWAAVIGGSLGGMQAIQWSIDFPKRLRHAVVIAAAPKLTSQNIAFNEIARRAIQEDPEFHNGHYIESGTVPKSGLQVARMIGHITYQTDVVMERKFAKTDNLPQFSYEREFEVEHYLQYQGEIFVKRFDANSYLLMTRTLDYFDPARTCGGDLSLAFKNISADFCVISFSSDWRFSPSRSREITRALIENGLNVAHVEIESDLGHDSFLLPVPAYLQALTNYMGRIEIA